MKLRILILLCTLCACPAFGQKQIDAQSQVWVGYFNQTRLADKWGLWLDVHARRTDFLARWNTLMIRPGITYYLNDHVRLTAGYVLVGQYLAPGFQTIRPEHRPWQQILWTTRAKRLHTQQWVRVEERFIRKVANDQLASGYTFNWRFRYLMNLMVPINREFIEPNTVFLAFNDEIHLNAGKNITYNYFDQNRLFVGVGYQFTQSLNAQVGYMNLFQQLPVGNQFVSNHVLRVFVFHTLDVRQ